MAIFYPKIIFPDPKSHLNRTGHPRHLSSPFSPRSMPAITPATDLLIQHLTNRLHMKVNIIKLAKITPKDTTKSIIKKLSNYDAEFYSSHEVEVTAYLQRRAYLITAMVSLHPGTQYLRPGEGDKVVHERVQEPAYSIRIHAVTSSSNPDVILRDCFSDAFFTGGVGIVLSKLLVKGCKQLPERCSCLTFLGFSVQGNRTCLTRE